MQDLELFKQLLGLQDPWQVEMVEVDTPSHRLDIYVGFTPAKKKGLFKGSEQARCPECQTDLPRTGDYDAVTLRHLPIAGLRAYLHVPPGDAVKCERESCACRHPWANPGSRFTQAMESYIIDALQSAQSNQAAAKMAGITSAEAREISEASGVAPTAAEPATTADASADLEGFDDYQAYDLLESGDVPGVDNSGWQRLIKGEIPVQTDSVALRMLLQRVRGQVEKNPGEETRRAGAQMLRQFFIKNQQLLRHELDMIKGDAPALAAASRPHAVEPAHIPPEKDPVWQRLIRGEINLDTAVVALQMMLERVRLSAQQHDNESTRMAGAKILRQFFIKHQNRLATEIGQLHGQPATATASLGGTAAGQQEQALPGERDSVWQKLISGDIRIESDAVSLKMLLERIRQAIARNPTEGNRVAGAKILRQYFVKNRHRHAAEIRQLSSGAAATTAAEPAATLQLPADNHPNWQRLINGEIGIHTDAVSLKMLLERIRQAVARNPSQANRAAGAKILRQYFLKNRHRHAAEIRALNDLGPATEEHVPSGDVSQQTTIPDINHPSWQRLINGEFEIVTDAVGLKMMLERIRLSIENNPSQASRLAGAKILRQYFIKHQNKHQAELAQLRAA